MRELRLVMLGLAVVMLLLIAAGFIGRALYPPVKTAETTTARPAATPRAAVEAAIADAPDYARFFDRLRLAFPSDYEAIIDQLAAARARRTDEPQGEPQVDVMMAEAVAALRRAHGDLAAKAASPAMAGIFDTNLREMTAMGETDPALCVAFLFGGSGGGFAAFAADHRALVADAAIAGLAAMSSGRTDGTVRSHPSDADFKTLEDALAARGLSRDEIGALLDGKTPSIPDGEMCKAGQTYYATLATLPQETRDRIYALAIDLMTKS